MNEELKNNPNAYFITLTINDDNMKKLIKECKSKEENDIATYAVLFFFLPVGRRTHPSATAISELIFLQHELIPLLKITRALSLLNTQRMDVFRRITLIPKKCMHILAGSILFSPSIRAKYT